MEHDESRFVLERKARLQLQQLIADGNTPQKIVKRARIILMTALGHGVMAIMREVGVSKTTVWRWQEYFAEAGVMSQAHKRLLHRRFCWAITSRR
jgi:DNA invertase Pin-like site-specific DNA recombinase